MQGCNVFFSALLHYRFGYYVLHDRKKQLNPCNPQADLFVAGEMGIGNTTPAAAIVAALLGGTVQDWVGRGTGVDDAGLAKKCSVVEAGLARHAERARK